MAWIMISWCDLLFSTFLFIFPAAQCVFLFFATHPACRRRLGGYVPSSQPLIAPSRTPEAPTGPRGISRGSPCGLPDPDIDELSMLRCLRLSSAVFRNPHRHHQTLDRDTANLPHLCPSRRIMRAWRYVRDGSGAKPGHSAYERLPRTSHPLQA